jgi:hypothetical protein
MRGSDFRAVLVTRSEVDMIAAGRTGRDVSAPKATPTTASTSPSASQVSSAEYSKPVGSAAVKVPRCCAGGVERSED